MIALARRMLGLGHSRADCNALQTDGIDTDALLEQSLRQWYLALLDKGDAAMTVPREVDAVTANVAPAGGGTHISPPAGCRRITGVLLSGWHHPVEPLDSSHMQRAVARQLNPYTRATASSPVAVRQSDGSIVAWPVPQQYGSNTILGTVDDGPESYTFGESALSTLATHLQGIKIPDYGSF